MAIVLPKFPGHRSPTAHGTARQPAVNITMCREDAAYVAGSSLKAVWRISRIDAGQLQGVEVSVLWHTHGKGDEDLGVIHFERHDGESLAAMDLLENQSLRCRLPASPLSYRGHLIQIDWFVRVRVFLPDGREIMTEQPFYVIARPAPPVPELCAEPVVAPEIVAVVPKKHAWLKRRWIPTLRGRD